VAGWLVETLVFSEDGCVSTTDVSEIVPAPAGQPPTPRRGLGNLRSMVISMVVIMVAVLAWVAMVPRVQEISQPAVDVASVATQARAETGWAISQPRLPGGWKATNVRFTSATDGVRTWHVGYLSPDGHYISIDQTSVAGATGTWVSAQTSNGQAEGTPSAAGTTWQKLSSPDTGQRSLLARGFVSKSSRSTGSVSSGSVSPGSASKGSVSPGSASKGSRADELTTVLSGTAPYLQLAQFAEALVPVPST
jgi:hypothetical protein